jgi:hypothetical protein
VWGDPQRPFRVPVEPVLSLGSALGLLMDNLALGIGIGVAIGIAIGLAQSSKSKKKP